MRWICHFEHFKSLLSSNKRRRCLSQYAPIITPWEVLQTTFCALRSCLRRNLSGSESHFIKKKSVIYKRMKFNMCHQEKEDSFVTASYTLAEHCAWISNTPRRDDDPGTGNRWIERLEEIRKAILVLPTGLAEQETANQKDSSLLCSTIRACHSQCDVKKKVDYSYLTAS